MQYRISMPGVYVQTEAAFSFFHYFFFKWKLIPFICYREGAEKATLPLWYNALRIDHYRIRKHLLGFKQSSISTSSYIWESTLRLVTKGLILEIDFPADQFCKELWLEGEIKWGIIIKCMCRCWKGVLLNHLAWLYYFFSWHSYLVSLSTPKFAKL